MTKQEFNTVFSIAKDNSIKLLNEDIDIFKGLYEKNFRPVTVAPRQIAAFIRWQAGYIGGGWDNEELDKIRDFGRKRIIILE